VLLVIIAVVQVVVVAKLVDVVEVAAEGRVDVGVIEAVVAIAIVVVK
jgi:hypothetical protein